VATQCDYGPASAGTPGPLIGSQDVGGKMAAAASILDGLAIDPNNGTGIFCPFDDGVRRSSSSRTQVGDG
jgi:hypothetical protein